MGYAQIGIGTTSPDASAILEVSATDKGFLIPRVAGVGAITETPVAGLMIYDTTEQCLKYYNGTDWSGCLSGSSESESLLAASGTVDCNSTVVNGTFEAGTALTASETLTVDVDFDVAGAWSASTGTINGYSFVGSGTVTATGIQSIALTATGTPTTAQTDTFTLSFNSPTQTCGFDVTVNAAGPSVLTITSTTGQVWMDRNLGASQVANSDVDVLAVGDLYQWGRLSDGHQLRTSTAVGGLSNISSVDDPGHSNFIISMSTRDYDWRDPHNDFLWQGLTGINNPCPSGFRIPTYAEFDAEGLTWSSNNSNGAFLSPLKLTVAGERSGRDGSIGTIGGRGVYWTSNVSSTRALGFSITSSQAGVVSKERADGCTVRCIKD